MSITKILKQVLWTGTVLAYKDISQECFSKIYTYLYIQPKLPTCKYVINNDANDQKHVTIWQDYATSNIWHSLCYYMYQNIKTLL